MKVKATFELLNAPETIGSKYIVARYVIKKNAPQLWYYGQYDDVERAGYVAKEIGNGIVFENVEIIMEDLTSPKINDII